MVSCSSAPDVNDKNFIGNYPARELEKMMVNSVNTHKNELNPLEIQFIFAPKTNLVQMKFEYEFNKVSLPLSQENRAALLNAMATYISDYQAGKLLNANEQKRGYFGSAAVPIYWGLLNPVYYTKPVLSFEYRILSNKKPYFIIESKMTQETDETGVEKPKGPKSPALNIAFSPLQCQHMIEMLNQDNLVKIVRDLDAAQADFDIPKDSADSAAPAATNEMF